MMTFIYFLAITVFLILCVLLCSTILVQESKGSGFGASFGGETGNSLFGTSTADVLKRFTACLGVIFMVSSLVLSFWTSSMANSKGPSNQNSSEMISEE